MIILVNIVKVTPCVACDPINNKTLPEINSSNPILPGVNLIIIDNLNIIVSIRTVINEILKPKVLIIHKYQIHEIEICKMLIKKIIIVNFLFLNNLIKLLVCSARNTVNLLLIKMFFLKVVIFKIIFSKNKENGRKKNINEIKNKGEYILPLLKEKYIPINPVKKIEIK